MPAGNQYDTRVVTLEGKRLIPKLLPDNAAARQAAFTAIRDVLSASAAISGEVANRLKRVAALFGVDTGGSSDKASKVAPFDPKAKAS